MITTHIYLDFIFIKKRNITTHSWPCSLLNVMLNCLKQCEYMEWDDTIAFDRQDEPNSNAFLQTILTDSEHLNILQTLPSTEIELNRIEKQMYNRTHWSEENKSWNTFHHNDCILFQEFHKQIKSYQLDMANEFINNFQNYKLLKGNHLKSNTSKQIVKTYVRSGVTFKFSSNSDCSFFFVF